MFQHKTNKDSESSKKTKIIRDLVIYFSCGCFMFDPSMFHFCAFLKLHRKLLTVRYFFRSFKGFKVLCFMSFDGRLEGATRDDRLEVVRRKLLVSVLNPN